MLQYLTVFGVRLNMYKFFFYLALVTVPVILFSLRKKFGYSLRQATFYSVFTLVFGYLSAIITAALKHVMLSYASGGAYSDTEFLRNYGIPIFLPVFYLIYCALRKDDFRKVTDYVAPSVYSVMTFVKVGCVFWGCCYAKEDPHGIWSAVAGYKTFPVQLYDAISSLIIFGLCILLIYKLADRHRGYVYPIGGMLFALTKGFWESFRVHESEYERSFLNTGLTLWQYWLIVLFLGCLIWLILVIRLEKNEQKKKRRKKKR